MENGAQLVSLNGFRVNCTTFGILTQGLKLTALPVEPVALGTGGNRVKAYKRRSALANKAEKYLSLGLDHRDREWVVRWEFVARDSRC